jgi:hypothetical protein
MIKKIWIAVLLAILAFASMGEAKPAGKKIVRKSTVVKAVIKSTAKAKLVKKPAAKAAKIMVAKPAPKKVGSKFVQNLGKILAGLKKTYAGAMDLIKLVYRPRQKELGIDNFDQLIAKTKRTVSDEGEIVYEPELVPLPNSLERFNIKLRLTGRGRIGEADKNVNHDLSYYRYTRKFVAGAMMELGMSLVSAKLDVTAISRTYEYQSWLLKDLKTKAANTDFPTHALAIAFDVGLINTKPADTDEIIRAADLMRAQGKIIINPEAYQSKCLHIVPTPTYQKYFEDFYDQAIIASN